MVLKLRNFQFDLEERALVMGILNRTEDSFFDHGEYFELGVFLRRAEQIVAEGADILDIGGVKAGPGPEISEAEELDRVVPAVELLRDRFDIPLSVDTWNARVIDEAMSAGASLGNDISGFASPGYLENVSKHEGAVVATHIRLVPRLADPNPVYQDLKGEVRQFLADRVERALKAGVRRESILVDAGFDLGKTTSQSMELLLSTDELGQLGYPVLISASNKGFIGEVLGKVVTERRMGSLSAASIAAVKGAKVFRVHDVAGTRQVLDVITAIMAGYPPRWLTES
ncbi:MAG: dihydropteroate synthase [Actinomycetota bacterium]|nr:MAG: dihydropteroate synthase [Actinomycetota bacterium]